MLDEYRFLRTDLLVEMVEVEADQYHPEAVVVAIDVLAERGIITARPAPEGAADKEDRAGDLAHSGYVRVLWGGALCVMGVALSAASGGAILFYGAAIGGAVMVINGLSLRGYGERLEAQARIIRTNEASAGPGALSPVDQGPGAEGLLSLPPAPEKTTDD